LYIEPTLQTEDFKQKLKNAIFVTLGWLVLSAVYAVYYVVSNLAIPTDAYAMTWDFQLLMFFIFRVPFLVLILLVLIAVVFVLPPRKPSRRERSVNSPGA